MLAVTFALKKLASSPSEASIAIDQFVSFFSTQKGLFGSPEARCSALRGKTSAADWWTSYGGQYKELQKLAKRIISQCMPSSGCERNWSTFALVHTKLRNRLGYEKLYKLVYVHYNLKLCIQQFEVDFQSLQEKEGPDPCSMMMDVALYDEGNPIMEWLCNSMSESTPTLDEYDDDLDWRTPSNFLIDKLQMEAHEVAAFKRKLCFGRKGGKKKGKVRSEEEEEGFANDYESDSSHDSPVYAESGDSSSDDEDDGEFQSVSAIVIYCQ
ncbi:uncharacterized protein LOC133908895 [Phragmites australis]|uniref:uncharacterized protein LOC133908895 n=1 Tax=Phragmites australis TaxID=29695 RepID=UPI002D76DCD6|nr:uncharacterized protein LOC133908895 [Phragmites australis]